ncbi:MAG TPA: DUF2252 domain-containing protein [Kofleriaceae bacterium]|nr:DUF2252 domain-containing protein [Kofleriaceae bacterium]
MVSEPARYLPRAEREAYGKSLRTKVKRADHAAWTESDARRDVVARLRASEPGRLKDLIAIRYGKMAMSPFAFLRGGSWVMAPDLAALPSTGYLVQVCGDAHVRNLGAFSGLDGRVVFDVNDFDETCRAPWEWDLKRLAVSIVIVGREARTSDRVCREAVCALVESWRNTMHVLADLPAVEVARYCVHRFDPGGTVGRVLRKAERMTAEHARDELARPGGDGRARFIEDPPRLRPVSGAEAERVFAALAPYRDTLGPDRQQVLDCYEPYDVAYKVGGTGALGARNYVVLCIGNGHHDPLILQIKQALPSCYEALDLVKPDPRTASHQGMRVAAGQHRMQTWTDPFLGWTTLDNEPCYVRQLSDHKASIDPADLRRASLIEYARVCGETFAKAHARTGDAAVLYGYGGEGDKLDRAIASAAVLGADQSTADWEAMLVAIRAGQLVAVQTD